MKKILYISFICLIVFAFSCDRKGTIDQTEPDYLEYPQNNPHNTLSSIIKAVDNDDIDYLYNHLIDPNEVMDLLKTKDYKTIKRDTKVYLKKTINELEKFQSAKADYYTFVGSDIPRATLVLENYEKQLAFIKRDSQWFLSYSVGID